MLEVQLLTAPPAKVFSAKMLTNVLSFYCMIRKLFQVVQSTCLLVINETQGFLSLFIFPLFNVASYKLKTISFYFLSLGLSAGRIQRHDGRVQWQCKVMA